MVDSVNLITFLTAIATLFTAMATLFNVYEVRQQRLDSSKPFIAFENMNISKRWDPKKQVIVGSLEQFITLEVELDIFNVGKGIANEVEIKWEFDDGIIDEINNKMIEEEIIAIVKGSKDDNGKIYNFTIDPLNLYNYKTLHYSPHPENQVDPWINHYQRKFYYRLDKNYKTLVPTYFSDLCLVYAILMVRGGVDDYEYKPEIKFSVEYFDVYGEKITQKFKLICRIYTDVFEENGINNLDFIFEVLQARKNDVYEEE